MVVNTGLLFTKAGASFLSHLCGGEFLPKGLYLGYLFLSHLCGGECSLQDYMGLPIFLSHLCGGEFGFQITLVHL
ncbi:hypothetical protein BAZOLSSOX_1413 [uncultured Gammaproteobacteria bacterium]|nr:hypothetical protein BAZOLSSOX_1413 [uncultured Gammaproteobacteria bacterium]